MIIRRITHYNCVGVKSPDPVIERMRPARGELSPFLRSAKMGCLVLRGTLEPGVRFATVIVMSKLLINLRIRRNTTELTRSYFLLTTNSDTRSLVACL